MLASDKTVAMMPAKFDRAMQEDTLVSLRPQLERDVRGFFPVQPPCQFTLSEVRTADLPAGSPPVRHLR